MNRKSSVLTLLASALAAGAIHAGDEPIESRMMSVRSQLRLGQEHALKAERMHMDADVPVHHLQQYYRGLKVWGARTNVRDEAGDLRIVAQKVHQDINIPVEATLSETETRSIVDQALQVERPASKMPRVPMHRDATPEIEEQMGAVGLRHLAKPVIELVVLPIEEQRVKAEAAHKSADQLNAEDVTYVVTGYRLVYHVATDAEVAGRREMMNYLVDAHTGEVVQKWNLVKRAAVAGTAKTKYSGDVTLYTNQNGSTYECKDPLYFNNYVSSSTSSSTPYTDADNVWGNNGNWADGTTVAKQTGAAEALYALQREAQMLKAVWGRNGSSGTGKAMKVVWGQYAASNTACYITQDYIISGYADSYFYDMNKLDIIGHEYGHSFDYYTAYLCGSNSGEAGGMAEAHADIMGLLTEVYAKYSTNDPNNPSTTIPEAGLTDPKTWICGEDAAKSTVNSGQGLRFFIKPSKDVLEGTIDAWKSTMASVEVHAAAGPTDRMFYYLAVGAPSSTSHEGYTSYLPNGSTGIGLHKAANIWVKTILSGQLSSSSLHMDARNACISTATTLYGANSPEVSAVKNAYAGINVGQPDQGVVVGISPATATVTSGGTYQFTASVTGTTNTAVTWTATGGTVSTSGLFTAPTVTAVTTYKVRATSAADTTKYAEATVTVNPIGQIAVTVSPTTATINKGTTKQFTASVTGTTNTAVTWTCTGGTVSTSGLYTAPATLGTYKVRATSAADTTKYAEATVTVQDVTGTEKILNGGFESGATSWTGTTGAIGTWSGQPAYEGTKCAWLGGNGKKLTETLYQAVTIPSTATSATLSFYLHIDTAETSSTAYDYMYAQVLNSSGSLLKTLATYTNANKATGYALRSFDVSAYKGQTIRVYFKVTEDSSLQTSFVVDKVSLIVK